MAESPRSAGSTDHPAGGTVFFSIVSANYLAYARVLMESVREHHPEALRYVVLADEPTEASSYEDLFELVLARNLGAPSYDHMAFRYSILEFNTALKPYAFRWLVANRSTATIVYLDPDIIVLSPLTTALEAASAGALAVLTPHLDAPLNDGKYPDETTFLRVGVYNLGFIATGPHPARESLIGWWAQRLEFGAYVDLEVGSFTDQKWMDLAPGLFPDVHILRHPGYNLAYWNLAVRSVERTAEGTLMAGNEPVAFVHFSGADLAHPQDFSKYQDRYSAGSIGALAPTYIAYLQSLKRGGHDQLSKSPYAYDRLRDGSSITPEMRSLFRHRFDVGRPQECPDPFGLTPFDFAMASPLSTRMARRALEFYRSARRRPYVRFVLDRLAPRARLILRQRVLRAATPPSVRVAKDEARAVAIGYPVARPSGFEHQPRANVIGYFEGEFGVAEASRQLVRAAEAGGVEVARMGVDAGRASRQRDRSMSHKLQTEPAHPVNILCINADQTDVVARALGSRVLEGRYNIGYWFWELGRFPDAWLGAIDRVDEVWTATSFVRDAVQARTTKPVRKIGVAINSTPSRRYTKAEFGLPSNRFAFLFSFDYASFPARKNPSAVIDAFRLAFPLGSEPVALVLKSINGHQKRGDMARLTEQARRDERIQMMDEFLSRDQVFGLESVVDSYVSLHRSEGFGLGLAESMFLGVPAIGTAYSGNLDFMSPDNSCLVGYELAEVAEGDYPFATAQVWAEPDVEHAAYFMRRLSEDPSYAARIGRQGKRSVRELLSEARIGATIGSELERVLSELRP